MSFHSLSKCCRDIQNIKSLSFVWTIRKFFMVKTTGLKTQVMILVDLGWLLVNQLFEKKNFWTNWSRHVIQWQVAAQEA